MANGETILIVDDESSIQLLLTRLLTRLDYICDTADNGLECLKKYKSKNYDLILLDINMPQLNGIDTLIKLKEQNIDVSAIVLSASRDVGNIKIALKAGAYDYIFKPFNFKEIGNTIHRAIERSKLIKENKFYQYQLEQKVVSQAHELVELYTEILEGMVLALDLREHETGYHSYRVTEYALFMARKMNLDNEELSTIARGALLHDIGKIGIPDSILLKKESLTNEEWEIMKRHPELGYNLLKKISSLEESARLVLTPHERFDGNGYPNKISGNNIPVASRIFSIVDALDAMTSNRTYRDAINFEQACNQIIDASGTQFDPEIIKHFVDIPISDWIGIRHNIETSGITFLKNMLYNVNKKAVLNN